MKSHRRISRATRAHAPRTFLGADFEFFGVRARGIKNWQVVGLAILALVLTRSHMDAA